jgi:hypothetical protein
MAVRYAVASGNWSTGSTWNGGTLPTSADDVYANAFTVTIDQDVTVLSLNTTASAPAVAGGTFNCTTSRTIRANLNQGTNRVLSTTLTTGGTITLIGNITTAVAGLANTCVGNGIGLGTLIISGSVSTTAAGTSGSGALTNNGICVISGTVISNGIVLGGGGQGYVINNTNILTVNGIVNGCGALSCGILNSGVVNLNGTMVANTSAASGAAIFNYVTGTVNVTSTQTFSGTTGGYCISNTSAGIVNINADILGSVSGTPSLAFYLINSSSGIVNINGSVIQRSVGPSSSIGIVNNASTGTININGNVGGGTVSSSIAVSNASTGTINVTGSVSGGTNAIMTPAIYSTTAGIITVTGNTISNLYPAIYSTNASATHRLYGNLVSNNGIFPIYGLTTPLTVRISPSNSQTIVLQDSNNTNRSFDTSNVTTGLPASSNVRRGITYGITNQYAGTMYVPTPDNVRKDVLTDNTVGTADLSVSSLIDTLTGSTNPMAVRLRNVSTAQITGSQIAGLLNNP